MKKILFTIVILTYTSIAFCIWKPTGQLSPTATNYVRAITSNQGNELFAAVWANGVYKSTNSGANWTFSGLSGKRVSYLTTSSSGDIYALSKTVDTSYIHRSTDDGQTWADVNKVYLPLNYAGGGAIVFPEDGSIVAAFSVTVGPTIGDVAIFIYKSTTGGDSWLRTQAIGVGFVGGMIVASSNKILLGTSSSGVLQSTNNGNTFISLGTFPSIFIKTIIKAKDSTIYVSDAYGLNRSTDNGLTFTDAGIKNNGVFVEAAEVNANGELYVDLGNNVYHSTDRGNSWTLINEGLGGSWFGIFYSLNGKMFGGTNNNGVMYYDNLTSIHSGTQEVNNFELNQNFPNPFNPKTIIKYQLATSENVILKVYDTKGNEVSILVNGKQFTGNYQVEFDGTNLSSGIYYYKIQAGSFNKVKKMILIK